jgi:murein DD-endopeptidase MepM/ murein hydrolase activator NlpD
LEPKLQKTLYAKNHCQVRTIFTIIGLAISVGTASILVTGQSNQAVGAEPINNENHVSVDHSANETGTIAAPGQSINLLNLPSLSAVDRFLPRPIDENTPVPVPPGSTNTAYIWPAKGFLTSGYGMRWGRMHRGIDIANKIGTPIYASASGVVEFEGTKKGYGNLVDIRHIDGSLTRYAHNNKHFVRIGQKVQQGETIAHMGSTGFSTGPHLHFEIHPPGRGAVNPIAYLPPRV